jgi:hypothetical protein
VAIYKETTTVLREKLQSLVREAAIDFDCCETFANEWFFSGVRDENMRLWQERNFPRPTRDSFVADICQDTAFLLSSVLYSGLVDKNGAASSDVLLNSLAWAFCAVPGYDLPRADAKKNLSYFLVEFQRMASQIAPKALPFVGVTDKMNLLFTVSPLRSGYLRPIISMMATSLAMLDDRQRANCYQSLRDFVTHLVNENEVSVGDLQTIVADLEKTSLRLRLGDGFVTVPDAETVSVLRSAVSMASKHKEPQSTTRESQPQGVVSPQVAPVNGNAESAIAELTGMIGLDAVKREVVLVHHAPRLLASDYFQPAQRSYFDEKQNR